jgi:hypothetical protein
LKKIVVEHFSMFPTTVTLSNLIGKPTSIQLFQVFPGISVKYENLKEIPTEKHSWC